MGNPRTPVEELRLAGSPNLKRALSYKDKPPAVAKRAELEQMFVDIMERRSEALADVRKDGLTIWQDHFHREKLYQKKVVNPALKIVQQCEKQLSQLAKQLVAPLDETGKPVSPFLEEFNEIFAKYEKESKRAAH